MIAIIFDGFLTGLILQVAIGPVFFYILNIALQKSVMDGLSAVTAVTIVDYLYITLAVLGVGELLKKPKTEFFLGIASSLVLILFGLWMIGSLDQSGQISGPNLPNDANYLASFTSTFVLTASSPLTIVFWTSLFAAKAIERGFTRKQLIPFGAAAGSATLIFLGASVTLFSLCRASIPLELLRISNTAVGVILIVYGIFRAYRIVRQKVKP